MSGNSLVKNNKELIFKRNYENSLYENEKGGITVVSHLTDPIHDIRITLDVSLPDFVISEANLQVEKAPGSRCRELCPRIEQLNGVVIKHGFSQFVRELFSGAEGCPNVVNMLLSSVPLAINTSWMIAMKRGTTGDEIRSLQKSQMKDVCISFNSKTLSHG